MSQAAGHPLEVDCRTVRGKLDAEEDFLLLDCRERDEWDTVRIAGATLLPMTELQDRAGELDEHREREVVVYCHHGGRSLRVAMWLRQQGFARAASMSGGVDEWAETVDPSLPRY